MNKYFCILVIVFVLIYLLGDEYKCSNSYSVVAPPVSMPMVIDEEPSENSSEGFNKKFYEEDGIRPPPPTAHAKNKTNVMWRTRPSQNLLDEVSVKSDFITPVRTPKRTVQGGKPRLEDSIPSHV